MSIFSLSWFKSKKKDEPKNETGISVILPVTTEPIEYTVTITAKPYKSVKMVNDVLTVTLPDGDVITKPSATVQDFEKVAAAKNLQEIVEVVTVPEVVEAKIKAQAEEEKIVATRKGIEVLSAIKDFVVKDDALYIAGTNRSIPQLVVDAFAETVGKYSHITNYPELEKAIDTDVKYTSLKKFWLKCCLNPSAQSAEDLYTFLSNHKFKIDRHGNFYAYRKVVTVRGRYEEKSDKVDFISNAYNKVKAVWKKKPSAFEVCIQDGQYSIHKTTPNSNDLPGEWIGNLEELYKELPNMTENRYTDQHTRSFDYRVGKSVSMPRHMGDDDNSVSCSKGFHAASKKYDYSGFGDTPILMIINPMDVLAVPRGEVGKLRVCRWFFAMTLPESEKYILDDESFDVTNLGDLFEEECMTDIKEYVQTSFAEEVQRHTFAIPQLSAKELNTVVNSLDKMKSLISKRVSVVN